MIRFEACDIGASSLLFTKQSGILLPSAGFTFAVPMLLVVLQRFLFEVLPLLTIKASRHACGHTVSVGCNCASTTSRLYRTVLSAHRHWTAQP